MSRHDRIHLPLVVAAFATAVSLAACGSSPSTTANTAASAGVPKSGQRGDTAYRFSDCMRAHGVPNFPDPQIRQNGNQVSVIVSLNPSIVSSPAFKSAQQACGKLLGLGQVAPAPGGAALGMQSPAGLAFARCMRNRGFPNFPDPTAHGQLTPQMVTASGINLHQPAVLDAGLACTSVTHGLLSRADVERAVNGG